nr:MAG TPA: hypothetical protein [Caudoviricetes sp.]
MGVYIFRRKILNKAELKMKYYYYIFDILISNNIIYLV